MKILWSAKNNAFFYSVDIEKYRVAGWTIDDEVEVSEETFNEFTSNPIGKIRAVGSDGMPVWTDVPPPTQEQLKLNAEQKKLQLRAAADAEISWRQDAVDSGIATDEETALLAAWKNYRVLMMRVDTSKAPDIEWPTPPNSQG